MRSGLKVGARAGIGAGSWDWGLWLGLVPGLKSRPGAKIGARAGSWDWRLFAVNCSMFFIVSYHLRAFTICFHSHGNHMLSIII